MLADIKIQKKDGTYQSYNPDKILIAIRKSADRTVNGLTAKQEQQILDLVETDMLLHSKKSNIIPVSLMHVFVENALKEINPEVATSYFSYRSTRKMWASMMGKIHSQINSLLFLGDRSNANADSKLGSTINCLMAGYLGTEMFINQFLNRDERQACEDGYIYVHDKDKRETLPFNCCLFDIRTLLKGGFESAHTWYNEPKTIDTLFDVVGDVVTMAASQQYGGFTLPRVDEFIEPYAQRTYEKLYNKYIEKGVDKKIASELAEEEVTDMMYQGFQGWEYKFNTVASSRGDYPFVTITFGLAKSKWGKLASIAALETRRNGQGKKGFKKPVLFPKLVFLYDKNLHDEGKELEDIFDAAVLCSSKTMYPDYLSLTGDGYVADIYKKYGLVISPMGCRAFLSPWYERGGMEPADENDKPVFEGRFNMGVVSLNLPLIYKKAENDCKDFYEVLDYYLGLARNIHKKTYDYCGQIPASRNPLSFCQGGLYGGFLKPEEKIAPVLKSATASFGITALNELEWLASGKSITEGGEFSLKVMDYIENKINQFKKEDQHLYAIYGTPAEKLCGIQVEQFRKLFGIVPNVSDRTYVTNSFHCHVTEDISPIKKQDLENRFWNKFNGGKVQYVRYKIGYNIEGMKSLIRRAMKLGFYEGVNLALSYCDDCGHEEIDLGDVCPVCGSRNLTKIDKMNGYLAYSKVNGDTRLNSAKMDEIAERISM